MRSRTKVTGRNRRAAAPVVLLIAVVAVAVFVVGAYLFKQDKHKFEIPHTQAQSLMANRPECPENWATFPLWPDSLIAPVLKEGERPREIAVTPTGAVYQPPNGELPLSGDITSIPEFHDCQRFLSDADKSQFGSLFAIFAAFQLDSIANAIGWDGVNWSTSNPAVATVNTSGLVLAVGVGTTTIRAASAVNQGIVMSVGVSVGTDPPSSTTLPPIHLASGGSVNMNLTESRQAIAEFGAPTASTLAAATIYSYGPGYQPLGIGPNFSCLYLYFDQRRALRAKMVPVNSLSALVNACFVAVKPDTVPGKELAIRRTVVSVPGLTPAEIYPPVARWDWDPETEKQFIGIMCGTAWCEIGEGPSFDPPPPLSLPLNATPGERMVLQVKGWHDEQILAVGSDGSPAVPSGLYGTVVPSPRLASASWTQTGPSAWDTVAYIAMRDLTGDGGRAVDDYMTKLNVRPVALGPLATLNRMSYCYGTKRTCEITKAELFKECETRLERLFFNVHRWWVRIETPAGETKIYCVTRRTHPGFNGIPATARWRWILSDDTVWTECINGCCQTQGGET